MHDVHAEIVWIIATVVDPYMTALMLLGKYSLRLFLNVDDVIVISCHAVQTSVSERDGTHWELWISLEISLVFLTLIGTLLFLLISQRRGTNFAAIRLICRFCVCTIWRDANDISLWLFKLQRVMCLLLWTSFVNWRHIFNRFDRWWMLQNLTTADWYLSNFEIREQSFGLFTALSPKVGCNVWKAAVYCKSKQEKSNLQKTIYAQILFAICFFWLTKATILKCTANDSRVYCLST
jgi:hypothetical protein